MDFSHLPEQEGPYKPRMAMEKVAGWFEEGVAGGHRFLLVCVDGFDMYEPDLGLYPQYCDTLEEAEAFCKEQFTGIRPSDGDPRPSEGSQRAVVGARHQVGRGVQTEDSRG